MLRSLAILLSVAAALCMHAAPQAHAAAFDPDLKWRTMETPHFNITFHQGEAALAEEVANTAESVWAKMTVEFETYPKRPTELVLIDPTDMANGYAMTLPVNTIVIFVTSPSEDSTLSLYSDWTDTILTHEYSHILHLDTIEGLPKLLRYAFGRVININRASPGWIVEGLATFQETRHTPGGRGRSNIAHMIKRAAVIEDQFPPLGNMDGFQSAPPGGNLRYLFGQDFIQYIADNTRDEVWTDWVHTYGGWIPFWLPTKRVMGKRFVPFYREWHSELEKRYGEQADHVRSLGETPTQLVSDGIGSCMGPSWSPSGKQLVFSCAHPVDGASIQILKDGEEEPEEELKGAFATDFTWRSDETAFFYSSSHTVDRFNLFNDIYFHKLGRETSSLMTRGKRARQPNLSPDGKELLVVTNKLQQNQLARLSIDQELEPITEFDGHEQIATPQFSPDGRFLTLSMWKAGTRDIWVFNADGTPFRQVTSDIAHDMDPTWSADGRWLYFSTDRTGIFNIFAIHLETEELFQVTNVIGGAFHPAPHPDGTKMAFESFSHNGMDIVTTTLGQDGWHTKGKLTSTVEGEGKLSDTISGEKTEAPPPEQAEPMESVTKLGLERLPSGIARSVPISTFPGLQGFGAPMNGWDKLPAFGNPYLDTPDSGPGVEHGGVQTENNNDEEEDFDFSHPVRRYKPTGTMFPPRYVRPGTSITYGPALKAFLGTSSWDTLMRWFYSGFISYRTDNQFLGWGASLAYNRYLPVFSAGAYQYSVRYGNLFTEPGPPTGGGSWIRSIEQLDDRYWDKRTKAYLQMSYPLDDYTNFYVQWQGTHRTPLTPLSAYEENGVNIYRSNLPTRGFQSALGAGWGYGKGSAYGRAISTEKGTYYGASAKLSSAMLGSYQLDDTDQHIPFTQLQFTGEWREYFSIPWFDDHVFATKVAGGGTVGDRTRYGSYRLGGNFGQGGLYTLPEEYRSLRGFKAASVYGDWYYQGSVEYRLPLWWIDRGVGTIPAFARHISAATFLDAGYAFNELPDGSDDATPLLPQTLVGTGVEVRGRAIIAYGIDAMARFGYAFGLRGTGAIPLGDPTGLYMRFDASF
jgi:hypothetical protein